MPGKMLLRPSPANQAGREGRAEVMAIENGGDHSIRHPAHRNDASRENENGAPGGPDSPEPDLPSGSEAETGSRPAGGHDRLDVRGRRGAGRLNAIRDADGAASGIGAGLLDSGPATRGLSAHGWRGREGITRKNTGRRSRIASPQGKSGEKQDRNGCRDTHGQAPQVTKGNLNQDEGKSSP